MIENTNPVVQSVLGTLYTWTLTALGAGLVVVFDETKKKLLDVSLGFAAGVMIAASYWSLLSPAIEMATQSDLYGKNGEFAFIPVAVGFFLGALFVYIIDIFLSEYDLSSNLFQDDYSKFKKVEDTFVADINYASLVENTINMGGFYEAASKASRRKRGNQTNTISTEKSSVQKTASVQWKRMLMLIIAITVHNIPEGLAVGVAFGAVGTSPSATFSNARNLAIGIGIQNFPEGLAVSLPLKAAGFSNWKSFWYGQLSGMVEPIAGIFGAVLVVLAAPTLPYALSFAAGAMIYVVIDDIIPEAHSSGNGKLATWGCIVGFLVMMALDVGLG
ncbi:hypothetical protein PGB90_005664 [Kerria lacca]